MESHAIIMIEKRRPKIKPNASIVDQTAVDQLYS
jgi:hypothetical protein